MGGTRKGSSHGTVKSKSPAEFFAENQNIAGFDNLGRSLYTTIREFVENSLDAAESIGVLPTVELSITELSNESFSELRGIDATQERVDQSLFKKSGQSRRPSKSKTKPSDQSSQQSQEGSDQNDEDVENVTDKKTRASQSKEGYFKIVCRDNGCGMPHNKIPDMFGRVLSGSKYGVKQARGKFGLGAKMALIWSKKSTGLPIEIKSAYVRKAKDDPPATVSYCKLDIDIHKNEPNIHEHTRLPNSDGWHGSEISVVISGAWTSYRARITAYLQQLAVITPYASFTLKYTCEDHPNRSFEYKYERRSQSIGTAPQEVKHHPKSVDNLLVKQLITGTKEKTLTSFLQKDFSGISADLAKDIVKEYSSLVGKDMDEVECKSLKTKEIHQLTQLLKDIEKYPPPSAKCLSPAGEYNLQLGILKEFKPSLIATSTAKPSTHNGHPFLVEAAVAIGGDSNAKPGLQVYRFANRIPLLFEAGSDVVTVTAKQSIKWSSYNINHKTDKIAVFVSIVSTKIPFKGTGKEYIGNDVEAIQSSVKEALCACCTQLRKKLSERMAARTHADRIKSLAKNVPDVTRTLLRLIQCKLAIRNGTTLDQEVEVPYIDGEVRPEKKARLEEVEKTLQIESITESTLQSKLLEAIQNSHHVETLAQVNAKGMGFADRKQFTLSVGPVDTRPANYQVFNHQLCTLRLQSNCKEE